MNKLTSLASVAILSSTAFSNAMSASFQPIPEESGASGNVILGVSAANFANNLVSGPGGSLGDSVAPSLNDTPESDLNASVFVAGELNYTFAKSRTQLFLGFTNEDAVSSDNLLQAGVRKEMSDMGSVYGALVTSMGSAEEYNDPYVSGASRDDSERNSVGGRIGWESIMGTGLAVELTRRSVEVDDEASGQDLFNQGLITAQQQALLNREGTQTELSVNFMKHLSRSQSLQPGFSIQDFDLDGEAMAKSRYEISLAHHFRAPQWTVITTVHYAREEHDEINPVYSIKEEADAYGVNVLGLYHAPFGWKDFSAMATVNAAASDSYINFYDAEVLSTNIGLMYRF